MHHALCDFLLELVENAAQARANRIWVVVREESSFFSIAVRDDGPGMTRIQRDRALDPFRSGAKTHPGRRVGLGLPLLRQTVSMTGGLWSLRTAPGRGTRVGCSFDLRHPDTPPVGEVGSTLLSVLVRAKDCRVSVLRTWDERGYRLDGEALVEAVGGLGTAEAIGWVRAYIRSREEDVRQGTGNGR